MTGWTICCMAVRFHSQERRFMKYFNLGENGTVGLFDDDLDARRARNGMGP